MAVAPGRFVLYSRIQPDLPAGDYRLTAQQNLAASGPNGALTSANLPVASLPTHLRVRSPRFTLPPDQVLSTFPPANSEGSYALRLPQIVIRRRTLPWERAMAGAPAGTPWLALVLIAEGEAEFQTNQDVAECVTPGVTLEGPADTEKGHYLSIRKSMIDKIFPTRLDVPLLAHAREVDINDTELMMGDDDGFLAVVIANRLPLPGRDTDGNEVPVKYLACLVNLEGQFNALLPTAPTPVITVRFPLVEAAVIANAAAWDHVSMGMTPSSPLTASGPVHHAPPAATARSIVGAPTAMTSVTEASDWTTRPSVASDIYAEMARPFSRADIFDRIGDIVLDPTYRFPVLLHWSFTSVGQATFRKLMECLDSGLLGTRATEPAEDCRTTVRRQRAGGRPELEVVETGHVGLTQRTRRGDEVRAWYRGPFVPHPTADPPEGRLPLAHASDQLRIVVPDGREDLSLSSAFEIGRLLALSRPSMVAALLRWRQLHYQVARRAALWSALGEFLAALDVDVALIGPVLGVELGRTLTNAIVNQPETFLGDPRTLVTAGRPLGITGSIDKNLTDGMALPKNIFRGGVESVIGRLQQTDVPLKHATFLPVGTTPNALLRHTLATTLDRQLANLVTDTLAPLGLTDTHLRTGMPKRKRAAKPDALDRLLDELEEENDES